MRSVAPRLFAVVIICLGVIAARQQPTPREIAITIDDLPVASGLYEDNVSAQSAITARLIAALRRQDIPAIGFVNEGKLAPHDRIEPARVALLQQWIDGGLELGNHTYSHPDFDGTSLRAYERDAAIGDSVTRSLLAAAHRPAPEWFRHPYLSTGPDSATRARFERWLADHGYRVAPVTINDQDYTFANAYERLIARHDSAGMQHVASEYVTYMAAEMAHYEHLSQAMFGRDIRQILLIHASALNADHLSDLAQMLRERGYTFVSLARAVEDSAYRSPDRYNGPLGLSWLHRWAMSEGKPKAFLAGAPSVPADITHLLAERRTNAAAAVQQGSPAGTKKPEKSTIKPPST